MVAFLDLVLPGEGCGPFQAGSRLQIFACRAHDDIAGPIYSDYALFDAASRADRLPADYWNLTDGHYAIRLLPPSVKVVPAHPEPRLVPQFLGLLSSDEEVADRIELFGAADDRTVPAPRQCSCGAPLTLLLQVPANLEFPIPEGTPEQPNTYSSTRYLLFLGNQLSLFACTAQCDPRALWPVLEN